MSLSLYNIEDSLQQLMELRTQAIEEGDAEAEKVIDQQIAEYLTKEVAKVTSYVALIRSREAVVSEAAIEIARMQMILEAAKRDVERLKKTALDVMNRFGVRELKATPGGGLRIQANGGLQPLEIEGALSPGAALPQEFFSVTVKMPFPVWAAIIRTMTEAGAYPMLGTAREQIEPNTTAIREALKQRVTCPECKGSRFVGFYPDGEPCPLCKQEGTIAATVPGAKLLDRGEHVRVL
jgi:hypothetical protein